MNEDQRHEIAEAIALLNKVHDELAPEVSHAPTIASDVKALRGAIDILENEL